MALPSKSRLSGKKAFSRVFERPAVSADSGFKVLARGSSERISRLGMAVSRQVDASAVKRNRLKRVIRESFRQHFLSDQNRPAVDIVVLPRREAVKTSNRHLFLALSLHWQKIDKRLRSSIR